jgi:hypothetical protein
MERPCVVRPAATSTTGYLGFLAGPTPIGLIAELTGLRGGLGVVVACTALPVLLAGRAHHDPRTASVRRQAADAWPVREEHRKQPSAGAGRGSYASANSGAATSRFAIRTAENSDQRVHQRSSRRSSRTCTARAAPELRPTVWDGGLDRAYRCAYRLVSEECVLALLAATAIGSIRSTFQARAGRCSSTAWTLIPRSQVRILPGPCKIPVNRHFLLPEL